MSIKAREIKCGADPRRCGASQPGSAHRATFSACPFRTLALPQTTDHRPPRTCHFPTPPQPSTLNPPLFPPVSRHPSHPRDPTRRLVANSFSIRSSWSRPALRCLTNCTSYTSHALQGARFLRLSPPSPSSRSRDTSPTREPVFTIRDPHPLRVVASGIHRLLHSRIHNSCFNGILLHCHSL